MKTLVLLNNLASDGKAAARWQKAAPALGEFLPGPVTVLDRTGDWDAAVRAAAGVGRAIVAAGGDGTVHRVVNLVLAQSPEDRSGVLFGAVGLGSSNDFHKPPAGRLSGGVPARCRPDGPILQNVLRVDYTDGGGRRVVEYAVTSCSLGVVALGNDLFNRRWGVVGACRRASVGAGIAAASLAGALGQEDVAVELTIDGNEAFAGPTCLAGVYVNRHFAGGLTYPGEVSVTSPRMGVMVLPATGRWGRLRLLARATRSGLPGPPATGFWQAQECVMAAGRPTLLEMDGEVVRASHVRVRLVRAALRVCQ